MRVLAGGRSSLVVLDNLVRALGQVLDLVRGDDVAKVVFRGLLLSFHQDLEESFLLSSLG